MNVTGMSTAQQNVENAMAGFFFFSGWHLGHMEISRLRVELELQLLAYATATAMPDPSHICDLQ